MDLDEAMWGPLWCRDVKVHPEHIMHGRKVQMAYPIESVQGAIELWMSEFHNSDNRLIDMAVILLDKSILDQYDVPCGIWGDKPRHPLVWRLMWCHIVCNLLGLPDPCNIECEDLRIVPKEIADAVQNFFNDEAKPPFWDAVDDS
jgi:hypothetical protein